jgi:signal transduction histidine kinase
MSSERIGFGYPRLSLDWIISHLRWVWLVSIFLVAWLYPDKSQSLLPIYVLIGAGAALNLIQVIALYMHLYPGAMAVVGVITDTLLAVLLLAVTGGWRSPLLPVVLFPVLVGSLRLGLEGGLASAVCLAFTLAFTFIYSSNAGPTDREIDAMGQMFQIGVNVLSLFAVAFVSGLIRHQERTTQGATEAKELQILRRANERAKAIFEMASTLSATLNYKRVLTTMLDLSMMGLTEVVGPDPSLIGMILLFEEEGNFERLKVHAGRNVPRSDENRVVSGQSGLIARAIYTAEPVIAEQVSNDPVLLQFICMQNVRSAICAPLRAGFEIFGVVLFASPNANYFHEEHVQLLTTLCNQGIIALRNAQLYQDLQSEQRKILAKEAEARHKLARELHDGPTQTISAIAMRLNFVRVMLKKEQDASKVEAEVAKIEDLARKTTQEVRTMLFTLRPVVLETQGLGAALEQYADRLRQTEELNIEVDPGTYDSQLDKEAESVVFSVVEEAVGNVKKHANANRVLVRLRVDADTFTVEIQDDGVGFDAEAAQRRREAGHMGLLNMQERAELMGGRFTIQSQPGAGTRVRLDIPLRRWSGVE